VVGRRTGLVVVVDARWVVDRGGGWDVRTMGNGLLGGGVVVCAGYGVVLVVRGVVVLDTLVNVRRVVTVGDLRVVVRGRRVVADRGLVVVDVLDVVVTSCTVNEPTNILINEN
jgi:hypothetical protein